MIESNEFTSKGVSKGAYQGVLKIRGRQESIARIPGKDFGGGGAVKDQAQIRLTEVAILRMAEGESEPELKDDAYTIWVPFAVPGKQPNKNTLWAKGIVASAVALGKEPPEFNGSFVTMERILIPLFSPETKEMVEYPTWAYVKDDEGSGVNIKEHIKSLVIGATEAVATRNLLTDAKAKQYPDYRKALQNGTIGELLGVVLIDGKFQTKEG